MAEWFLAELAARNVGYRLVGPEEPRRRKPGSLCIAFEDVDATRFCELLPDIAISHGSACNGPRAGSHVLEAIGVSPAESSRVVRLAFGRFNALDDVVSIAAHIGAVVHAERENGRAAARTGAMSGA
jgi:cysteine sulfinate desulfinase/cysteine desulfurase-like protein